MNLLLSLFVLLFFSFLGLYFKEFFSELKNLVVPLLALVMLGMGITLKGEDFKNVLIKPHRVIYAAILQFTLMPSLGYMLGRLLSVEDEIFYGAVLVGSAPGGTASNLITYLSKGDLAYSVSMTAFSTLISPFVTPGLVYLALRERIDVPFSSMFKDMLLVVFLPLISGIILRNLFPKIKRAERILPYLSLFSIGFIIAVVLSLNGDRLREINLELFLLVMLHNTLGFLLGYLFAILAGMDRIRAKTLSIEVGMQNSGLAVVLSLEYFPPLSALPGALFSLIQNLNGLLLSHLYRRLRW